MVQPRKEQIKSVNTKFTFGDIILYPGYSDTIIPVDTFAVTGIPGGAEEDVQASTLSYINSSYPILAGDAIRIAIDDAPSVLVTFAGTDTTVSRVASKINTALGFDVAFNQEGLLYLRTVTVGASSSIVLSDVSPGVLTKLGLVAGTYTGLKGPTRGILTRTPDGLGGLVRLATKDGRHLVTDVTDYRMVGSDSGSAIWAASVLGGTPIHGRLTYDGYGYHIKSYAKLPTRASAITFNSSFTTLDGSDQVDLNIDGVNFSVSFGFFGPNPNNRDWVVQLINSAYAGALGFYGGHVYIVGTISGPFSLTSGDSFTIRVDGGSQIVVVFTGTEVTASDVANTINAAVGSFVATNYFNGYQDLIYLLSPNNYGIYSSIELVDNSLSGGVLSKLGLRPGMYRGPFIAEPYGPDEIRITSQYRGTGTLLQIGGFPATLTKLGLTAGSYGGSDSSEEELVLIPYQRALDINGYPAEMIFPEVMEFGDIDPAGDSRVQKFLDKSAGSNQSVSSLNPKFINTPTGNTYVSPSRGLRDVGKPVTVGPDGSVAREYLQDAIDQSNAFFKQFLRYPGGIVTAIVSNRFEGTGYGGNAIPQSQYMEFFLDPNNSYPNASEFDFYAGTPTYNYSNLIAGIARDAGVSATFGPNTQGYIYLANGCALVNFNSTPGPLSSEDSLKFVSKQTYYGGGTGYWYIPFTAAPDNSDGVPRLAEGNIANNVAAGPYSIMRTLNARHEVTLGDGITTFGDFNGSNALHQVQSYLYSIGATRATIKIKPGYYVTSYAVDFGFLTDLVIDGYYEHPNASPVLISHQWAYECLHLPTNGYTKISGIAITNDYGAELNLIWVEGGILELNGCWINAGSVYTANLIEFHAYRTDFIGQSMPITSPSPWWQTIDFDVWSDDTHHQETKIIEFNECYVGSVVNGPAIAVYDFSTLGTSTINLIKFNNCKFDLSNVPIFTDGPPTFESQGGIISFNPSSDGYANLGAEVRNVQIYDCSAWANNYGTGHPVVLNVMPNGWNGTSYYTQGAGNPAIKIDNFDIKRLYVGFWNTDGSSACPAIAIGGIGVDSAYGGKLTFEDVVIDPWYSAYGPSTNNMNAWFTGYVGSSYGDPGESKGGLVCLAAKHIEVKNVTFLTSTSFTNYGELFLCSYGRLTVEGIEVAAVNGGYGSYAPDSRICVRELSTVSSTFDLKGIHFYNLLNPDYWAASVILIEARPWFFNTGRISDFYISLLGPSDSYTRGIRINQTKAFYSGYDNSGGGLVIENGYIGSQYVGSLSLNGFLWGMEVYGDNIAIRDVVIDSCKYEGIYVESRLYGSVSVENCDIKLCGNALAGGDYSSGLCLFSRRTPQSHGAFNVNNNIVSSNNADPGNCQINIRDIDPWGAKTTGQVRGNSTVYDGDRWGILNVCLNIDTSIPAGFITPGICRVQGIETGYSGDTGAFAGNGANGIMYMPNFWPYIAMSCIQNFAVLTSNLSYWT